ncbi:MAG: hypothetical protein GX220_09745 [Treponema sp.]|nr:hypothetical protein [Treponema sp.]
MNKKIFKTADGNLKIYGWVKISKIIEDLPVIGITSEKGIRLRFNSFVEKGILDRETINTQKGKKSFYRTTSIYDSLINTVAIEKVQEKTEKTSENSQRNCSSFAEENLTETQEKISQRKKTTYAKNQIENNDEKSPQGNCNSLADRNCNTFGQRNCSSLALNNSLFKDSLNKNSSTTSSNPVKTIQTAQFADKNSEEEVFLNIIIKLFGYNPCFNPNPYPIFVQNLKNCNLSLNYLEEYLTWIFADLKPRCKNKDNFVSYFFKSFTQPVYISKFAHIKKIEIQKLEEKKARQIICPVCGFVHDKNDYFCPNEECKYPGEMLNDENNIQKEKAIFQLKKNDNSKYQEYQKELNKLIEKYPFTKWFMNKDIKQEFDNLVSELEIKYLNIKKSA